MKSAASPRPAPPAAGGAGGASRRLDDLTAGQRRVLAGLAAGWSRKMTAAELGLAPKTVDAHCTEIYRRLGVHSLAGALAKRNGWPKT